MTLPTDFESYTRNLMGEELFGILLKGLDGEAPASIRLNPFKIPATFLGSLDNKETSGILEPLNNLGSAIPWCPYGFYLKERPAFTFDPMLHAGLYYVQESSSMFICEVVRQLIDMPVTMLDLCAAPGGKSTALRSVLPEGSLLFSNEPIKTRASILKENIIKFGHPDVLVTNNYPKDYRKTGITFDAILADVPCSGEGMFRKDPNAISEWSKANVEKCRQLQRSIIEDIWPCLRPGGLLIYSTCTFNALEDEENVAWIAYELGADPIALDIKDEWNITGSLINDMPVYRFIPGKTKGEGLFLAVLRKKGENDNDITIDKKSKTQQKRQKTKRHSDKVKAATSIPKWLEGDFTTVVDKDIYRAIPTQWSDIYNNVYGKLHIIHAGIELGTEKGKSFIPNISTALSTTLDEASFPKAELDYDDAIMYLRKEALTLPPSIPHGIVLITYKGYPIGFVKNIGNHANNLYPQEWRIKSSHAPSGSAL